MDKHLTPLVQTGHVLNDLKSATLLSAGQLCDDNCTVILTDKTAIVKKDNKTILQGYRNRRDSLWDIKLPIFHLPNTTNQVVNAIVGLYLRS